MTSLLVPLALLACENAAPDASSTTPAAPDARHDAPTPHGAARSCAGDDTVRYQHAVPLDAPVLCRGLLGDTAGFPAEQVHAAATALRAKALALYPEDPASEAEVCAAVGDAISELRGELVRQPFGDEPELSACQRALFGARERPLRAVAIDTSPLSRMMDLAQKRLGLDPAEGCWVELRLTGEAASDARNILYGVPYTLHNFSAPAILFYASSDDETYAPAVVSRMSYTLPAELARTYEGYLDATSPEDFEKRYPADGRFELCLSGFYRLYDPGGFERVLPLSVIDPSSAEELAALDGVIAYAAAHLELVAAEGVDAGVEFATVVEAGRDGAFYDAASLSKDPVRPDAGELSASRLQGSNAQLYLSRGGTATAAAYGWSPQPNGPSAGRDQGK